MFYKRGDSCVKCSGEGGVRYILIGVGFGERVVISNLTRPCGAKKVNRVGLCANGSQ